MSEIKNKQVGKLHDQINALQIATKNNCQNIEKLLPLVSLIPTLNDIVEDEKSKRWLAKRIVNCLKITGIIIGFLAAIFGIGFAIMKEVRK